MYGLQGNPIADVERLRVRYDASGYDFYSPEEVWALVRAAASQQDGAMYLTAAFTGMRLGELLALRVRDVDFEAEAIRAHGSLDLREGVGSTKSGKGRTIPMVPEVAQVLAQQLGRDHFTNREDPVFATEAGGHLDGSALRRRYKDAQTRAEAATASLPRSQAYVWVARDHAWIDVAGPGLDGPRRPAHDGAVHALQESGNRGRRARRRVSGTCRQSRTVCPIRLSRQVERSAHQPRPTSKRSSANSLSSGRVKRVALGPSR